jgi:hypothetical protein
MNVSIIWTVFASVGTVYIGMQLLYLEIIYTHVRGVSVFRAKARLELLLYLGLGTPDEGSLLKMLKFSLY